MSAGQIPHRARVFNPVLFGIRLQQAMRLDIQFKKLSVLAVSPTVAVEIVVWHVVLLGREQFSGVPLLEFYHVRTTGLSDDNHLFGNFHFTTVVTSDLSHEAWAGKLA